VSTFTSDVLSPAYAAYLQGAGVGLDTFICISTTQDDHLDQDQIQICSTRFRSCDLPLEPSARHARLMELQKTFGFDSDNIKDELRRLCNRIDPESPDCPVRVQFDKLMVMHNKLIAERLFVTRVFDPMDVIRLKRSSTRLDDVKAFLAESSHLLRP